MNKYKYLSALLKNIKVEAGKTAKRKCQPLGIQTWNEDEEQRTVFSVNMSLNVFTTQLYKLRVQITLKKIKKKSGFKSRTNTEQKAIKESIPIHRQLLLSDVFSLSQALQKEELEILHTGSKVIQAFSHKLGRENACQLKSLSQHFLNPSNLQAQKIPMRVFHIHKKKNLCPEVLQLCVY